MSNLITADQKADYKINEVAPIIVAALAWVLAIGGAVIAAIVLCGWRGAKNITIDWFRGKASFYCR